MCSGEKFMLNNSNPRLKCKIVEGRAKKLNAIKAAGAQQ